MGDIKFTACLSEMRLEIRIESRIRFWPLICGVCALRVLLLLTLAGDALCRNMPHYH